MKKILLLFFAFSIAGFAQEDGSIMLTNPHFTAGLGLQFAIPVGEHKDQNDDFGIGGNIDLAYQFTNTPILAGVNFAYTVFGSETREEAWSSTIPDVRVDVTTTNSYMFGTAFIRLQPDFKYIMPYFEGHIGFNYLQTTTSVEDQNHNNEDDYEIASSTDLSDAGFMYGVGGGIEIPLYRNTVTEENFVKGNDIPFIVTLDIQGRYLFGSELEYLKEDSKTIVNGKVEYDKIKSKTDIFALKIGVAFKF